MRLGILLLIVGVCSAQAQNVADREVLELDKNCIISVLNRTVQADKNGNYVLPNVPSFLGEVRARATCNHEGRTVTGQTDFFSVANNDLVEIGSFYLGGDKQPIALTINNNISIRVFGAERQRQLNVLATYADGSSAPIDISISGHGVNFSSSDSSVVSVNDLGVMTSHSSGEVLITARKDGVLAVTAVSVIAEGDKDGDGLPDHYENLYGLNPNDPIDAFEDLDGDGLSNLDEFLAGTGPNAMDTDGDGISDGEELQAGNDGVITAPLLADTDGDGLRDELEIRFGFDPNDALSGDLDVVLESITVTPNPVHIVFNTMSSESTQGLKVTGLLIDGTTIDLTFTSRGTTYSSDNLSVVSFGQESGKLFAGAEGVAQVTVTQGSHTVTVPVTVTAFTPEALSAISIPGYANEVAIYNDYALVAAGSAGLQVVNVENKSSPEIVAVLQFSGVAIDIEVRDRFAYVALGEAGLAVVDVQSPEAPVLITVYDTPGFARDLLIHGDNVVIADSDGGVRIINVANHNNIFEVGSISRSGVIAVAYGDERLFVANQSGIAVYDVQQWASPVRLSGVNLFGVKAMQFSDGQLHVAAYSYGWVTFSLTDDGSLSRLASGRQVMPRGVAAAEDFVFWAEQLFPNVIGYNNIQQNTPFFQNTIDLFETAGDYAGTGIAIDDQFIYVTEEYFVVEDDWGVSGDTKLVIAQYRKLSDLFGIAPQVDMALNQDVDFPSRYELSASASDDVGIQKVDFYYEGRLVFSDLTYPYSYSFSFRDEGAACETAKSEVEFKVRAIDFAGNSTWSTPVLVDPFLDCDGDGLENRFELEIGTDPELADTDGDLLNDAEEYARKTNPLDVDSDADGIDDGAEVTAGTDPLNPDTTPPELSNSIPLNNATDVREDTSISLIFDGAIKPESVSAASIQLLDPSDEIIDAEIALSDDGVTVSIQPYKFLMSETVYRVSIVGLRDAAGNHAQQLWSSFQTGINGELDDVGPVVTFLRAYGFEEKEVPTNVVVTVLFNEPIAPESLTSNSFYLQDNVTRDRVDGSIALSSDRKLAQFIPSQTLHVGRSYTQFLTTEVQDLWGNGVPPYTNKSFSTGYSLDTSPPEITATTLPDGLTNVPTNVRLRVRFNERISKHTLRNVTLLKNGEVIESNYQINDFGDLITLMPVLPLDPMTEYHWQIGAVEDMAGNLLESNKAIRFETGSGADTTSSRGQEWVSFLDEAYWQGRVLPSNVDLRVRLLERVDPTTVEAYRFSTFPHGDESPRSGIIRFGTFDDANQPFTIALSDDAQTITLVPDSPLVAGPTYLLSSGAAPTDLAGNSVATNFYTSFKVSDEIDSVAPVEVTTSFDGIDSVLNNGGVIRLNYSEFISERCISGESIELMKDGVNIAFTASLASNGRTIIIEPDSALSDGANYSLSLTGVCDLAGNQTSSKNYDFSVSNLIDDTPPRVIQAPEEPLPAGTSELVWVFDEDLDPSSIVQFHNAGAGSFRPMLLEGRTVVEGNTLRFVPEEPFMQGMQYYGRTSDTWVRDLAGNQSTPLIINTAIVNDVVPPSVIATSPMDGAINVAPNQPVTIQFSEPMNFSGATLSFWAFGELTSPSVMLSPDRTTATIYGVPGDQVVSLVILGATDYSGNVLPNHILTYTTLQDDNASSDLVLIEALAPEVGATGLASAPEILLHSKYSAINESTLADGLKVYVNNAEVEGSISLIGEGRVLRFVPNEPFKKGDRIDYQVHYTATDVAGRSLGSFNSFFTMADNNDREGEPPSIVGFYPALDAANLPANTVIDVLFSEEIDAASLSGNILLFDQNGSEVPSTVAIDSTNNRLVSLQPNNVLLSNHMFTLKVLGGLHDTDGDSIGLEYSARFTTGNGWVDDRAPTLLSTTPEDGVTDVSINAFISAKYDEPLNPLRIQVGKDLYHVQLSQDNTVVRYQFRTLHAANRLKELQLPAVEDGAKNIAQNSTLSFTVGVGFDDEYFRAPTVVEGDNAIAEFIFEKPVDPLSVSAGTVILRPSSGGDAIPLTIELVNGDKTIYVSPTEVLPVGYYKYSIEGVHDLSGNHVSKTASLRIPYLLADERAPNLLKARVPSGLNEVPLTISLAMIFDEVISGASLDIIRLINDQGDPVEVMVSRDGTLATVIPRFLLQPNARYTLVLGGVSDLSGNVMTPDNNIQFETAGQIGPEAFPRHWVAPPLTGNTPSDDFVPVNTLVKVGFDRAVDATRLSEWTGRLNFADIIDVTSDAPDYKVGARVSGRITLSEDLRTISITPTSGWREGRVYRVALGESEYSYSWADNPTVSAYSLSGQTLRVSNSILFRTSVSSVLDATPPTVLRTEPEALSSTEGVTRVKVFLDELLSPACEEQQVITLENVSGVTKLDSNFSSTEKSLSVWVAPSLVAGVNTFSLSGACDVAGNTMLPFSFDFTVAQ